MDVEETANIEPARRGLDIAKYMTTTRRNRTDLNRSIEAGSRPYEVGGHSDGNLKLEAAIGDLAEVVLDRIDAVNG
jgi:hypothetical protein